MGMCLLPALEKRSVEAAMAMGTTGVVGFFVAVPSLIVALLLTEKKNVWQCAACGFLFERR